MPARSLNNLGVQLGGATLILLIVIFAEVPSATKFASVIQNSGHAPAYGLLALLIVNLLKTYSAIKQNSLGVKNRTDLQLSAYALLITVVLGIGTEVIQGLIGRDAEVEDVFHDCIGAIAALAGWLYVQAKAGDPTHHLQMKYMLTICIVSIVAALTPLLLCTAAYWHRDAIFPVIAEFRSPLDLYFVDSTDPQATIDRSTTDKQARIDSSFYSRLDSGSWPGITINEPAPDWRKYTELRVDISNPGNISLPLVIRIDDTPQRNRYDDRFNQSFSVPAGERTILRIPLESIASAPLNRRMDLAKISQIIVFHSGAAAGQALLLHRIWLQ